MGNAASHTIDCWPLAQYLDGPTLQAALALNKPVKKALQEETNIYTRNNPRFIHGAGFKAGR